MRHRRMVGLLAALVLSASCLAGAAQAAPPPNIVFILVDDLRWDALGCTGHPFVKTPHIDRIAREGARFRNAFVTTPLCLPSRGCFLTGQYAHTHGVTGGGNHDARSYQLVTFPRLLHDAGYETAYVGKWHIGNDKPRPGFDRWVSFSGQGKYIDPDLNVDGKPVHANGYMTDLLTDHAIDVIQAPHTKPWLLYLAYTGVHAPFIPADRHKNLFADIPIVRSPSAKDNLEGKPVLRRDIQLSPNDPDVSTSNDNIRNQLRCLMAVDEAMGRIFKALEKTGTLDQTLIVFTSDNGYFWSEHGLGGKHGPYEEALRIPLLMRYPQRIRSGSTLDALVLNVDIAPTLLELAGAKLPDNLHGRSLLPLLADAAAPWRTAFLAEYFYNRGQTPRFPTWQSVRTDRWKYIRYPDHDGMDELYALDTDPHEIQNRIDDPGSATTLLNLKSELERLLKQTSAVADDQAEKRVGPYFQPPPQLANDLGPYRSPLLFADGRPVKNADDWQKRREEILKTWHDLMGPWPPLLEKPKIEYLEEELRENVTQHHVRLEVAPMRMTDDAYLLVPRGDGPFPAVLVVYYDAKTGIGQGKAELRDFAWQLARRGFVTLSLGSPPASFYPNKDKAQLQPLSYHAYVAANCHTILAGLPQVDPRRIGVVGHSYGGKWAMFASCLYEKFACAAWSDGGIVFDEKRGNVNYWEPWYLGYEPDKERKPGIPTDANPRTGTYRRLVEAGRDLHELHALMAPRPFLVSGGSEDQPERWRALNHSIAVNKFLGRESRVAMTNRAGHNPTPESNEQIYLFFEHFLKAEGSR